MQITSGIDIVNVERIKEKIKKSKEQFLNKIFTENEIKYCESRNVNKYLSYAARFAAKEAAYKAVSNIIKDKSKMTWKTFEVENVENGKPNLKINLDNLENIESLDLSLSHEKEYAIANVIILWK